MIFSRKIISLFLISLTLGQPLYALQTHQIMRKVEQDGRDESENTQNEQRIALRKVIEQERKKKHVPAFHIHEEIVCTDAEESPEGLEEIVRKTRFSANIVEKSPLHFSVMTEVIKAHLYIAETLYQKGEFIDSNQLRYHTDEESFFYPDDILKETVFDVYKSPLYLKHVIMPVIQPFMSKADFQDTHLRLDFLSDPTNIPAGMKDHKYIDADGKKQHFRYYKAHIDVLMQRFDGMRQRYFSRKNRALNKRMLALTSVVLYHHAWQSYKNTGICPRYSEIIDPIVETYYMPLPDYHDTYVMGYGLLARAEALISEPIRTLSQAPERERQFLTDVMNDFRDLYLDIVMDNEKRISYAAFEKRFMRFKAILKKHFIQ